MGILLECRTESARITLFINCDYSLSYLGGMYQGLGASRLLNHRYPWRKPMQTMTEILAFPEISKVSATEQITRTPSLQGIHVAFLVSRRKLIVHASRLHARFMAKRANTYRVYSRVSHKVMAIVNSQEEEQLAGRYFQEGKVM